MATKKKRNNKSGSKNSTFICAIILLIAFAWMWTKEWPKAQDKYETLDQTTAGRSATPAFSAEDYSLVKVPDGVHQQLIEYPGFTVSFNPKHHVPNYVTWELTSQEAKASQHSRTNKFFSDTNVKGCPTDDDYRNSGYDRGHMAPAGDMKWDADAMKSSFVFTNMVPQSHDLNAGAWSNLEEKCRQWAERDSAIIIVCGPVLTDRMAKRIGETKVAVPKRFFKVVLAPYANPPRAIGFIMPNAKVPGGMQTAAVSVDSVEKVTGFDFFSVLPDDIENRIEAECNFPRWSRKKY